MANSFSIFIVIAVAGRLSVKILPKGGSPPLLVSLSHTRTRVHTHTHAHTLSLSLPFSRYSSLLETHWLSYPTLFCLSVCPLVCILLSTIGCD